MTRTGWVILGLFVLVGMAVVSVMGGKGPAIRTASTAAARPVDSGGPAATAPTPAPAMIRRMAGANGLVVPVAGVAATQLADSWGDPRGGGTRGHTGLDIMAPRGTPVIAAAAGRIDKIFWSDAGGRTLYVRSPTGRLSYYYAHLDGYARGLREGTVVRAGQFLGTVGDSGNAGPGNTHLHFGMSLMAPGDGWSGGRAVNPHPLLAGARTAR